MTQAEWDAMSDDDKLVFKGYKSAPAAPAGTTPGAPPPTSANLSADIGAIMGGLDPYETMDAMFQSVLQYSPELAAQSWEEISTYYPEQMQLAWQMANKYLPKQYGLQYDLSNQYMPLYNELLLGMDETARTREMENVRDIYAPMIEPTMAATDPSAMAMKDELEKSIMEELMMGPALTPVQNSQAQQATRAAEVSRGTEQGSPSSAREAVDITLQGIDLQNQRQAEAQNYLGFNAGITPDPWSVSRGSPTQTANAANMTAGAPMTVPNMPSGQAGAMQTAGLGTNMYGAQANSQLAAANMAFANQQYMNQLAFMPMLYGAYGATGPMPEIQTYL